VANTRDVKTGVVVFRTVGRLNMLQWRPRLVALAAVVTLLVVVVLGAGFEEWLNLYW
jgi:hypothetical protein